MKEYLLAALTAFLATLILTALLIPVLRRLKAGQNILSYVQEHKEKSGTPTMGGLAFTAVAIVCALAFAPIKHRVLVVSCVIGGAYMAVGLLDDLLKKKHGKNLGLTALQKLAFQTLVAVFAGIFCVKEELTVLYVPFFGVQFDVGWWMLPLSVFVFLATVNAVNLTDGLDGLAAGVSTPFFGTVGLLLCAQREGDGLAFLCFALVGALLAYLVFNSPKASVFMGDTGSLALGGFASCVCLFSGNALYIPLVGVMFVVSVITVAVQVIYYKATGGKRVFLMSPVHHHFQQRGYAESKISYVYAVVTAAMGAVCLVALL